MHLSPPAAYAAVRSKAVVLLLLTFCLLLLPLRESVPRRYFFCGSFLFLFCLVFAMSFYMCFVATWLTSWLSFMVSTVSLSLSHWYPGSGVVLDCIDS